MGQVLTKATNAIVDAVVAFNKIEFGKKGQLSPGSAASLATGIGCVLTFISIVQSMNETEGPSLFRRFLTD